MTKPATNVTIDISALCNELSKNIPAECIYKIQNYYIERGDGYRYLTIIVDNNEIKIALNTSYGNFWLNYRNHIVHCKVKETTLIQHIKRWIHNDILPAVSLVKLTFNDCIGTLKTIKRTRQ